MVLFSEEVFREADRILTLDEAKTPEQKAEDERAMAEITASVRRIAEQRRAARSIDPSLYRRPVDC